MLFAVASSPPLGLKATDNGKLAREQRTEDAGDDDHEIQRTADPGITKWLRERTFVSSRAPQFHAAHHRHGSPAALTYRFQTYDKRTKKEELVRTGRAH